MGKSRHGNRRNRTLTANSHAPQYAPLGGVEVGSGMQRAAVVPEQQIARLPHVLVNMGGPLSMLTKLFDEAIAFLPWQTDSAVCHQAIHQQAAAASFRMNGHGR